MTVKGKTRWIKSALWLGIMIGVLSVYVVQQFVIHRLKCDQSGEVECVPLLGWFTREDRAAGDESFSFEMLKPGDVLITLSTHSLGWRHGHAALVLDEETTLESTVWGEDSCRGRTESWKRYSGFAVLRVKDVTNGLGAQVTEYAEEKLCGVPYHLSAGFVGEKAPDTDESHFGVQCAYLVWYAWHCFGVDLDSDGGRLVTPADLLLSDKLEVVEVYGIDPMEYLK